jgi:hypothetical protein
MPQVLVGFFTSYWDGEDALHALQALGLTHPVIQKSRVFGPESLDHERGIHGSLQTDPDGFGAGFAIALAAQETTE